MNALFLLSWVNDKNLKATASDSSTNDEELLSAPKTSKISPREWHSRSGGYAFHHSQQRAKVVSEGQEVLAAEAINLHP